MRRSWELLELRALVIGIGNVWMGYLLEEVSPPDFYMVVEVVVKLGSSGVESEDLCFYLWCLYCCRIKRKFNLVDYVFQDLRM